MSKMAVPEYLLGRIETLKNVLFTSRGKRSMSVKPGILEKMRKKGKQIQGQNNELLQLLKAAKRNVEDDLKRQKKPIGKVVTASNFAKSYTRIFKSDQFRWSESVDGKIIQHIDSNYRLGMFVVQILDGVDVGLRQMTDQEREKYIFLIQKRLEDKKLNPKYLGKEEMVVTKGLKMAQFGLQNIHNLEKPLMEEPEFPQQIGSLPDSVQLKLPNSLTHLSETLNRPLHVVKDFLAQKKDKRVPKKETMSVPSYIGSTPYSVRVKLSTPMSSLLGTFSCPMRVAKGFVDKLRGRSKSIPQQSNEEFEIGDPRQAGVILDLYPVAEDILNTPDNPLTIPSSKATIEELRERLVKLYHEIGKEEDPQEIVNESNEQVAVKKALAEKWEERERKIHIANEYQKQQTGNRPSPDTDKQSTSVAIVPVRTENLKFVSDNPYLGQSLNREPNSHSSMPENVPEGLNPIIPEPLPDMDTPEPMPFNDPLDYDSDEAWAQVAYRNQQNGKKM